MNLRQAAALAAHVASRNAAVPILQHVRIDGTHVVACNVEQQIEIPISLPGGAKLGAFCAHAASLTRILKALPEEAELELHIKNGRMYLTAGPTHYELNTLAADDFPRLDMPPEDALTVSLAAKPFLEAVLFCMPAMAVKDIRYYLLGLHIGIHPGRMELTATDGHRLHRARVALEDAAQTRAAIIPAAGVTRLLDVGADHQDLELTVATTLAIINAGGETLSVKLIDGQFPDAERIIPATRAATGSVGRLALAAAVTRVAQIFVGNELQAVSLEFARETIGIQAVNAGGEIAHERFEWAAADGKFKGLAIGVQWRYLVDALEAFAGERVNLHLPDKADGSLYLTDADAGTCQAVIMPTRV